MCIEHCGGSDWNWDACSRSNMPVNALDSSAGRSLRRDPNRAPVLARLLRGGAWSTNDLVEIVGPQWRGDVCQLEALAALLRLAIPPSQHHGLSDAWERAVAHLAGTIGPLSLRDAKDLVQRSRTVAAHRTESLHHPRRHRQGKGRTAELPAGDLAWLAI